MYYVKFTLLPIYIYIIAHLVVICVKQIQYHILKQRYYLGKVVNGKGIYGGGVINMDNVEELLTWTTCYMEGRQHNFYDSQVGLVYQCTT